MKKGKEEKSCTACYVILLFTILSCIVSGIFLIIIFPNIFNNILKKELTISPGTAAYKAWKNPSIPTKIRFYLFSVENPVEVVAGSKPKLAEKGPYVYREEVERVEDTFNEDGTVTYKTRKFWYLVSDESASLDDVITSLDIPQFAAAESVRGKWGAFGVRMTLSYRKSLFVEKTARELLFEGFSDPLLTVGSFFNQDSSVPMDRFGWFYGRNGTTWSDDVVTMATGAINYDQLGDIKLWKNVNRTHYPGQCGQLKGSACGFVPIDPEREFIDYFSTDICRPIRFSKESSYIHNELPVDKYSVDASKTFGNATTNPTNACFYANHPGGIHNSTGCKDAGILPVFVSLPHFLGADPSFMDMFREGSLSPDASKHSAYMVLQSNTSIPVQIRMRMQIMMQLRKNPDVGNNFSALRNTFLPLLWFEAEADTDQEMEDMIWFLVYTPTIASYCGIGLLVGSLFLLVLLIHQTLKRNIIRTLTNNEKGFEKGSRARTRAGSTALEAADTFLPDKL